MEKNSKTQIQSDQQNQQQIEKETPQFLDIERKESIDSLNSNNKFTSIKNTQAKNSPFQSNYSSGQFHTITNSSLQPQEPESLPNNFDEAPLIYGKQKDQSSSDDQVTIFQVQNFKKGHRASEDQNIDKSSQKNPDEQIIPLEKVIQVKQESPRHFRSSLKQAIDRRNSNLEVKTQSNTSPNKQNSKSPKSSHDLKSPLIQQIKDKQIQVQKQQKKQQSPQNIQKLQKKSSNQSPKQKGKKKAQADKFQFRKIPQKLFTSYDQLNLTVDPKEKSRRNKDKSKDKAKQKQKIQQAPFIVKQQVFAPLPIIEGYCSLKIGQSHPLQTKYVIIKNMIVFQASRKIEINKISKVKFLQKGQQLFIKFTYLIDSQRHQVFILTVLSNSQHSYSQQSFIFFSQIILRKLLTLNFCINQVTQMHQKDQQYVYQGQLIKKAQFFNTWEKRKLRLDKNKLQSFKGNKCTYQIDQIAQIWTRFQMMSGYLIVKTWHKYEKVQLGIPLMDYTKIQGKNNWLYGLTRIVQQM